MKSTSILVLASIVFLLPATPGFAGTQDGARFALHLTPHAARVGMCDTWSVPCTQFKTDGAVGVGYDAYLVVAGAAAEPGIAGLSCGIAYDSQIGHGADAFSWTSCGALQFPTEGENGLPWPDSGAGIRMTWDMNSDCQQVLVPGYENQGGHVVAGSFYVYAYSNDVFQITPNTQILSGDELAVSDCAGNISYLDDSAAGNLHFSHAGTNRGYNPCTGIEDPPPDPEEPPPPPPDPTPRPTPTSVQDAAFMLHVVDAVNPRTVCEDAPLRKTDVVTMGTSEHNGRSVYYVYVLGTPRTHYEVRYGQAEFKNDGLLGLRFGIDYDQGGGQGDKSSPLKIFSWNSCGASGGPTPAWPEPMSGNTLVLQDCQPAEVVPFGYFYVAAYAPATMSFVGFPSTSKVEYSTCANTLAFNPVDPVQVGWVALHGGSIGLDTDGCNPAVEPCTSSPAPAQPMTWGKLKSRYRTDPQ